MASTYTPIATTTLGSAQSSVTFSTISGSYTDLVLVVSAAVATSNDIRLRFNSDTGNNYSTTILYGTGSAAGSARVSSESSILTDYYATPTSTLGNSAHIISIQNYSNSTTYKTTLSRSNAAGTGVDATVGLWRSTSAITSLTLICGSTGSINFNTGSTFTLYGIKAA
jgi:hypothetical protein